VNVERKRNRGKGQKWNRDKGSEGRIKHGLTGSEDGRRIRNKGQGNG